MEQTLIDELKGGIPALVALVPAIAIIRFVCGHPALRRLRLALSLLALAISLTVFQHMAPTVAAPFRPYLWVTTSFAGIYFVFKAAEVVALDVLWRRRARAQPPGIFRDVMSTVFASVVLVVLLQVGLNVHVAALVITSAALSIFLGLALQQTVSDLFAGVALVVERPFTHGDWVRIGDRVGLVEEISWRAVRIRLLRVDDYLIVPNSVIAKADIVNMSSPTRLHGATVDVGMGYRYPPNRVRDVMTRSALDVAGVLPRPAPVAELLRFDASWITYRLTYWIDDVARSLEIESAVRTALWYAFQRHGLEMPVPMLHTLAEPLAAARAAERAERDGRISGLLRDVDFLAALKPDQLERLADAASTALYPAGAAIFETGEPGDSLFVVASGRVDLLEEPPGGGALRSIGSRQVGDYFGEMSLLTGIARMATARAAVDTELVVLERDRLRPILVDDPAAAERLSETLARHRAGEAHALADVAEPRPAAVASEATTLLEGIKRVFGLA